MSLIAGISRNKLKHAFSKANKGITITALLAAASVTLAVVAGVDYFNRQAQHADILEDARKTVATNLAKPCAEEAGKISALLLSDPNLTCDGPRVIPSVVAP